MKVAIDKSVLAVLSAGTCRGTHFFLSEIALDRKLYLATNQVLERMGGKWKRSAKAHVFSNQCEEAIESAIETGTYAKAAKLGWFPTPNFLAEMVVERSGLEPGMTVLEPSAGLGAIARVLQQRGAQLKVYEIDPKRAQDLEHLFPNAGAGPNGEISGDFLALEPRRVADRVCMNPPFEKRADIHHVLHARRFLRPGGRLVSIMSAGIAFREDRLTQDFRRECSSIEALPSLSFRPSGTDVETVIVTMAA